MQNLLAIWSGMDLRRRFFVVGATVTMFMAVLGLSRLATTPSMALLYSGLDPAAAGQVVAALEQRNVPYTVDGSTIEVPASQRDSLRMTLASEGLPASSGTGYELLDGLTGFGTTSQMFDAAYWRAKEGELARTILANPQIRAARVHIAQAPSRPFQTGADPSASITVTTAAGGLDAVQAKALRYLVAAAVAGLKSKDVAVIDTAAGLIPLEPDGSEPLTAANEKAEVIRANVEHLLAARVGPGKAVVEVAVELVSEREEITEHTFDPQGRVAISTDTEQKTDSRNDAGGDVTVASNLPSGAATAGGGDQSQSDESRERINYEVSETQRAVIRAPGDIRRLTVAVLVDGQESTADDGTVTTEPRSEAEIADLQELVASAVGLDESRGDALTVKSMPFVVPPVAGTEAVAAGWLSNMGSLDIMALIRMTMLAVVALVLGLFVLRPILTSAPRLPAPVPPLALTNALGAPALEPLNGFIDDTPGGFSFDPALSQPDQNDQDPVQRLRRLIGERQAESVEILRGWMENAEERT